MINIKQVNTGIGNARIENFSLEVKNSQIVSLLCAEETQRKILFDSISGYRPIQKGSIRFWEGSSQRLPLTVIGLDKITLLEDWEIEIPVKHWLTFIEGVLDVRMEDVLEMMIKMSFPDYYLYRSIKELPIEYIRILIASIHFAQKGRNWVIHDFCKGAEKWLELKFSRLLFQKRESGDSILYITNDLFLSSEISDRICFIKHGQIIFEARSEELREMDFKELYSRFLT